MKWIASCMLFSPNLFFFFFGLLFLMFNKLLNFSSLTCVLPLVYQGLGPGPRGCIFIFFFPIYPSLSSCSCHLCPTMSMQSLGGGSPGNGGVPSKWQMYILPTPSSAVTKAQSSTRGPAARC